MLLITPLNEKYEASRRIFLKRNATSRYPDESYTIDHSSIIAEVDSSVNQLPWYAPLIAGALAGVVSWIATFPFDVVKTRVQSVDLGLISRSESTCSNDIAARHPFRSTISTIVQSYQTEGPGVFFRGLSPTLIR